MQWDTPSLGTPYRYSEAHLTSSVRYLQPRYSEVHRAEVQWVEEALLTPICDPSLHCTVLGSWIQLWKSYELCELCDTCIFCHLALHSSWKKNCKAVSNKLMRNARPTQQRRKLKCSLFPKRKFVKLFRRETCCLPLQVNCHILVELRFSDRSVQNREVYSNLTLSSPTQGLSVHIVQVWIDEPELWVTCHKINSEHNFADFLELLLIWR